MVYTEQEYIEREQALEALKNDFESVPSFSATDALLLLECKYDNALGVLEQSEFVSGIVAESAYLATR